MPTATRTPRPIRPPARPALAAAIALRGMTFAHLAVEVEVTADTISAIVRGVAKPSAALAQRIAAVLGVDDVAALFDTTPTIRRLVAEALAAGVLVDHDATERLVAILTTAGRADASAS